MTADVPASRPELDAVGALILDVALHDPHTIELIDDPQEIWVLDDPSGALALAARAAFGVPVRVRCDGRGDTDRVQRATTGLPGITVDREDSLDHAAAGLALLYLPKANRALAHRVDLLAPDRPAVVVAGGRVKHMRPSMNDVLRQAYGHVHATRGARRSRCLVAAGPRVGVPASGPLAGTVDAAGRTLVLHAVGGVFAGSEPDHGGLLLLSALADHGPPEPRRIHDLGCGNGLLTFWAAQHWPRATIAASDDARDAVASTRAGIIANGLRGRPGGEISVTWQDAASDEPGNSVDLVLLNPPFHQGAAVDTKLGPRLFAAAARLLRPGGELWVVHNSHLAYRRDLDRLVGATEQIARDRRFTVLRAVRG